MKPDACAPQLPVRQISVTSPIDDRVRDIVDALFHRLTSYAPGTSLHYHEPERGILIEQARGGAHTISYRLNGDQGPLGEITLRGRRRFSEVALQTIETLIADALPQLEAGLASHAVPNTTEVDSNTGAGTRASFDRLLARDTDTSVASILLVRIDDDALTVGLRRRIALQIAAVIPDPDRMFAFDSRTMAVALGASEAREHAFLAERIRLMVAAMPAALPAPTVTVVIATAGQLRAHSDVDLEALVRDRNRVVTL